MRPLASQTDKKKSATSTDVCRLTSFLSHSYFSSNRLALHLPCSLGEYKNKIYVVLKLKSSASPPTLYDASVSLSSLRTKPEKHLERDKSAIESCILFFFSFSPLFHPSSRSREQSFARADNRCQALLLLFATDKHLVFYPIALVLYSCSIMSLLESEATLELFSAARR